ncbi:hypothetical protein ABYF32_04300 [Buchananella felis]|uniref:hypothetical protein n=1 Tax=Buchananella felis TaxID=3231492 RepID=UPI0035272FB4
MGLFGWFGGRREPSKYELLGRYTYGRRPIRPVEGEVPAGEPVPAEWRKLPLLAPAERVELMISLMRRTVGEVLPQTLAYLEEHCSDAELAVSDGRYCVVYTVRTNSGRDRYYGGGNPLQPSWPDELVVGGIRQVRGVWDKVPEPLKSFYEQTHDGFYVFMSHGLGLIDLNQVHCLGDYDTGGPWQERFAGSYTFYSHVTGGYLVLDIDGPQPGRADMWWGDSEPELGVDFWRYLDEQTVGGFNPPEATHHLKGS